MYKLLFYTVCFCCLAATPLQAQKDEELVRLLHNKNSLTDIMNTVTAHYRNPATIARLGETTIKNKLKRWKRWEWWVSSRLGPGGTLTNYGRLMEEARQQNAARNNIINSFGGSWTSLGPTSTTVGLGRADRIAFHPTDPNTVFAGTSGGGLWKTTNGGISWSNLTPELPSPGISGISVHPLNPDIIHILTGDGDSGGDFSGLVNIFGYTRRSLGVLRTTDGGQTWQKMGNFADTLSNLTGFALQRDPDNANILLAATTAGLFRTTNSGSTWTKVLNDKCVDVLFKPTGTTCYAITRHSGETVQYHISQNGGSTWNPPAGAITGHNDAGRSRLAVTPQNSNILYILCGNALDSGVFAGLLRSTQSGDNLAYQSLVPNIMGKVSAGNDNYDHSGYNLSIAVRPNTTGTIVTGAVRIWRNSAAGVPGSWVYVGGTHADVHDLQYNPLDNKLWAATDGGVYYSSNNGDTWTEAYNGMSVSQVYRMEVRPSNYLQLLAGLQDNGIKYKSSGTFSYTHIQNADGFGVGFDAVHDSIFYASINEDVIRFTDNGNDKQSIKLANGRMDDFYFSMAVHTTAGNSLFIGSDSIWRTTNGGATWSVSAGVKGGWYLRTCPSNGNRIYAAGGVSYSDGSGILRRSDDGGATWEGNHILSSKPTFPINYPKITSINVTPNLSSRLWVTFGGFTPGMKVYYSDDAGETWVNRSGTLPNVPVNCIVADNSNNVYAGTDNGVYYRSANASDWVPFNNGLPYVPVTDLIISSAENRIRAATFGRGIWSSDLYSSCSQADMVLAGVLDGRQFYEASNTITTSSVLQQTVGTKIQMRGGNEVRLLSGFSATESTEFHALTGPCGSGGVAGFRTGVEPAPPAVQAKKALLQIQPGSGLPTLAIMVKEAGEYQLTISTLNGEQVQQVPLGFLQKGLVEKTVPAAEYAPGTLLVHLYRNGELQHTQEWAFKK